MAEFPPGSPGGSWVIIKQLLRGMDWNQVYWWSLFNAKSAHEFGGRFHSYNAPHKLGPNRRFRQIKGWLLENIVAPLAARDLRSFIAEIEPDFIFFLNHVWGIPIVRRVMPHVECHWHLALHDMPDTASWVGSVGRERTTRFMSDTEQLYRLASSHDVIGPEMAEDMRQRTGVACNHIFRCAVEPEILMNLKKPVAPRNDDIIKIGYAGTIIAEETFARFVTALKNIRERISQTIEIHLFSWHSYKKEPWFDSTLIIEHGAKTEAEIYTQYQKLTWGLAIMKLDDDDPRYNQMSFPCKFTAALSAGLPLICLGNKNCSLMSLAKNYRLGLLFTDEDLGRLEDRLCTELTDFSPFPEYRREIARCAMEEFNAERNRAELIELINSSTGHDKAA